MADRIEIFIPYIAKSTNAMYAGQHWSERKRHKSAADKAVMVALAGARLESIKVPVDVEVYPTLGKGVRTYDVSNYGYTYKLIEDSLVSRGLLGGDSVEYVRSVKFCAPVRNGVTGVNILIILQKP